MVLALLLMFSAQGADKPLLDQLGVKPTGRNGYEELVQAADVLIRGRYRILRDVDRALTEGAEPYREADTAWAVAQFEGMNSLQRKRWLTDRFRNATDLVRQAVKKPITDPRIEVSVATLFPELSGFRLLAHHLANVAHVERSYGRDVTAVDTWMMGIHCMDRIQRSTMISFLVGRVGQTILWNGLAKALPNLSHSAAERLEASAKELSIQPSPFYEMLSGEFRWMAAYHKELKKGVSDDDLNALFGDEDDTFKKLLKELGPAERAKLPSVFKRKLDHAANVYAKWAAGGPKAWINPPEMEPQPGGDALDQVTEEMISLSLPMMERPALLAAVGVVQVRLLHVGSAVVRYRWEHGRLPAKLADVLDEESVRCPLTDEPFVLTRLDARNFTLKSLGVPKTGEITLTSSLPRGADGPVDPAPSLSLR